MTTQAQRYQATGKEFLAEARDYLTAGNLRQASEKGWGAAAQMIKCIAHQRGWRHRGHHLLFQAVNRLTRETGDRRLQVLFHAANSLHTNFYEGVMPAGMVEDGLAQVTELVELLDGIRLNDRMGG